VRLLWVTSESVGWMGVKGNSANASIDGRLQPLLPQGARQSAGLDFFHTLNVAVMLACSAGRMEAPSKRGISMRQIIAGQL